MNCHLTVFNQVETTRAFQDHKWEILDKAIYHSLIAHSLVREASKEANSISYFQLSLVDQVLDSLDLPILVPVEQVPFLIPTLIQAWITPIDLLFNRIE